MITLSPALLEAMLPLVKSRLPVLFSLLNSVNDGFSENGIETAGRAIGQFLTPSFQQDEEVTDAIRLIPVEHDQIVGDEEIGPGSGSDAAVGVGESGEVRFLTGSFSNDELAYVCAISSDGLLTFTNSYESTHEGYIASKDGQFFIAEMTYSISTDAYYDSPDIGRYGLLRSKAAPAFLSIFKTLLTVDGDSGTTPVLEIYAGVQPDDPFSTDLDADPIVSAAIDISAAGFGPLDAVDLNFVTPVSVEVPDSDSTDLWARIIGCNGEPAIAVPVYLLRQTEIFSSAGGGLLLAADGAHPGDFLQFSKIQFVQPVGELGLPASAGFVAPAFSASQVDSSVDLLLRKTGSGGASMLATTADGTALAGVDYVASDDAQEWAAFDDPIKTMTVDLIPIDLLSLDWDAPPDGFTDGSGTFPPAGEGDDAPNSTDEFGNGQMLFSWTSGDPRRAVYVTEQFPWDTPERPFQWNVKLIELGKSVGIKIGAGELDDVQFLVGLESDSNGSTWLKTLNNSLLVPITFEAELLTIRAKISPPDGYEGDASASRVYVKFAVNGQWLGVNAAGVSDDPDSVPWMELFTSGGFETFFLCAVVETDEDHQSATLLHWQGADKPIYFTVHLHDPNPATLLDGEGIIDTAKVTIFQNRLKDYVADDDCLIWTSDEGTEFTIPDELSIHNVDSSGAVYSDYINIVGTQYFEFSAGSDMGVDNADGGGLRVDYEHSFEAYNYDGSAIYHNVVDVPDGARYSVMVNSGGAKFAVNGLWLDPETGNAYSDPDAVGFFDIFGEEDPVIYFDSTIEGTTTFYQAAEQLYRPAGVSAYEWTHFCNGNGPDPDPGLFSVYNLALATKIDDLTAAGDGDPDAQNGYVKASINAPGTGTYYMEFELTGTALPYSQSPAYPTTYPFNYIFEQTKFKFGHQSNNPNSIIVIYPFPSSSYGPPQPIDLEDGLRVGAIFDNAAGSFKYGAVFDGTMYWVVFDEGSRTQTWSSDFSDSSWITNEGSVSGSDEDIVFQMQVFGSDVILKFIPYGDDQLFRPEGYDAPLSGTYP